MRDLELEETEEKYLRLIVETESAMEANDPSHDTSATKEVLKILQQSCCITALYFNTLLVGVVCF